MAEPVTAEEYRAAARRAYQAGDMEAAKRLIAAGRRVENAGKGTGQRVREFFLGDNDPTTQNLGEKIGTALNKAGESMTFGLVGDEASAAAAAAIPGGMGYDERLAFERQQERLLEETNPGVSLAADLGGAVGGALLPFGAIGTLGRGAGMGARIGASATAGAGMGGLAGAMEGEGLADRIDQGQSGAVLGGIVGAAAPVIGSGVQKVADDLVANRAIRSAAQGAPTTEQLRAQGNALYGQIDDAGVQIRPEAFERTREQIINALRANTGFDELPGPGSLTPNTSRVTQIMREASGQMAQEPTAALPFRSLDQMRRQAGAAAGNVANRADRQAGMTVIEGLDDFVKNLSEADVTAGDFRALQTALPKARSVWSRMTKSQLIDDAMERSENYLSGPASGLRNQFKNILQNPKLARAFTDAEKKAMRRVAQGSVPEQLLYMISGGLGNLTAMTGGAMVGGVPGFAAATAASAGLRTVAESVAQRNAEIARAIVAKGGMSNLPVATDTTRQLSEALLRRGAAAAPQ